MFPILEVACVSMHIAILGAGAGGFSFAADLHRTFPHLHVLLAAYPEYASKIVNLRKHKLKVRGIFKFDFIPNVICDVESAIVNADLILVTVPAFAQERYMQDIIKYGRSGQYVFFVPGNFASFIITKMLAKSKKKFYIAETETLPYTAKFFAKNELTIKQRKRESRFAFFGKYPKKVKEPFHKLFPTYTEEKSILKINLINPGPPLHVATTILNASRIEQMGSYETSSYDVSPSVANILNEIDAERRALAERLGLEYVTILKWANEVYPGTYDDLYEFLKNCPAYQRQISPDSLKHRYIEEEIPYHFVPLVLLGKKMGVRMPVCESLVFIANALNRIDYWELGRDIRGFFRKK